MSVERVMEVGQKHVDVAFDGRCVDALESLLCRSVLKVTAASDVAPPSTPAASTVTTVW